MEKFLKIGTGYYPAKNVVSISANGGDGTAADIKFDGVAAAVTAAAASFTNVELLIQEINFGKQVIIDTAAIAAL